MANKTDNKLRRQLMLLMIENKMRALLDTAQILNEKLSDPTAPRAEIETHLAANDSELSLLSAIHDQIDSGSVFNFPKTAQIEALRKAIADLETLVAQAAAVEALIVAGNTLIKTVGAEGMT